MAGKAVAVLPAVLFVAATMIGVLLLPNGDGNEQDIKPLLGICQK